jgi:hypothetical protein
MRYLDHWPKHTSPDWPANLAACIATAAEQVRADRWNEQLRATPAAKARAHKNARD